MGGSIALANRQDERGLIWCKAHVESLVVEVNKNWILMTTRVLRNNSHPHIATHCEFFTLKAKTIAAEVRL